MAQLLLGKFLPALGVSLFQGVFLLVAAKLLFGLSLGTQPLWLLLVVAATAFAATGLAMLVASLAKTETQVAVYGTLLVLVLAGIGGSMMPRDLMPETMRQVSHVTPHAWALDAYQQLLLNPDPNLGIVAGACGALCGIRRRPSWRSRGGSCGWSSCLWSVVNVNAGGLAIVLNDRQNHMYGRARTADRPSRVRNMVASIDIRELAIRLEEVLALTKDGREVMLLDGDVPRARLVPLEPAPVAFREFTRVRSRSVRSLTLHYPMDFGLVAHEIAARHARLHLVG